MEQKKIKVEAIINADRKKVWDYYTNPKHIINWNFAHPSWHCPNATNDLKVAGIYKARMEAKDGSFGFDFEAIYTHVKQEQKLEYEFGGRLASVEFKEIEKETQVTIIFDPETENPLDLQQQGWQAILNNLKNYAETN